MGYAKFESKIKRSSNYDLREYSIYSSLSGIILGGCYISQKKKERTVRPVTHLMSYITTIAVILILTFEGLKSTEKQGKTQLMTFPIYSRL